MKCKSKYSKKSDNIFDYEILDNDKIKISKIESFIIITKEMFDEMFEKYNE